MERAIADHPQPPAGEPLAKPSCDLGEQKWVLLGVQATDAQDTQLTVPALVACAVQIGEIPGGDQRETRLENRRAAPVGSCELVTESDGRAVPSQAAKGLLEPARDRDRPRPEPAWQSVADVARVVLPHAEHDRRSVAAGGAREANSDWVRPKYPDQIE